MSIYQITIDTEACDGVFACLTRDPRFVEDDNGLATIAPDTDSSAGNVRHEDGQIVAEFDDNRIDEARQAAVACPTNAITVDVKREMKDA